MYPKFYSNAQGQLAETIIAAMKNKGYRFFDHGMFNLNLIGIRNSVMNTNTFNDLFVMIYLDPYGEMLVECFPMTTDPGFYYLENPINVDGTAILPPGQYPNMWRLGVHRDQATLVQSGALKVWRDNNRDELIDVGEFGDRMKESAATGINLHDSGTYIAETLKVDRWSAGCQVLKYRGHRIHIRMLAEFSAGLYGDGFTYTLLEEKDLLEV